MKNSNMIFYNISFVNNLQRINDSSLFIATTSNIFNCVFKRDRLESAESLLPSNDGTFHRISCFVYSSSILWVGTISGMLYRMDASGNISIIRIPENYGVRSLAHDDLQNIWVGTEKGLYVYNDSGTLLKSVTTQSGLLNDCIYALMPVKDKPAVFASSNLGLSYVSFNGNIINYTKESGLQENEFNTESAVKTLSDKFYFGGVNGITAFFQAALSDIRDYPVLNITQLIINDSTYHFSSFNWRNDSIVLNYNQNHLQINMSALGLLNTNEYKYQYRLKDIEQNWQTTTEPVGIKYILPPGNYVFEIKCSPLFSSNSTFRKSIVIIVSPAWWQTWWFKTLLSLFCLGTIVAIAQQYSRRRYLQKIRALELNEEIQRERERISRDLHDNLGAYAAAIASNISSIQDLKNKSEENFLNQLKTNSQSIINQLNDTIWALNKKQISFTALSDRFKVFLQKIEPNYPDIYIEIKENIKTDAELSPANALHLFRIMQEAVNNALRHSGCNKILIELTSDKTWEIMIMDDGKGMPAGDEKQFSGNGLNNIITRAETAGWKAKWINVHPSGTVLMIIPSTTN